MVASADSYKLSDDEAERGSDVSLTLELALSTSVTTGATTVEIVPLVDETTTEKSGDKSEGPHDDAI